MSNIHTYIVHIDADTFDPDDMLEELIYDGLSHVNEHTGHTIYSVEVHEANIEDLLEDDSDVITLKFEE